MLAEPVRTHSRCACRSPGERRSWRHLLRTRGAAIPTSIPALLACVLFASALVAAAPPADASLRVAAIGDYGEVGPAQAAVSSLIQSLDPAIIITMGDNSYNDTSIDDNVGQYYADYIGSYVGTYGPGSLTGNRFFPSLGNHDYSDGLGLQGYLDYFTLPGIDIETSGTSGNERYYDFILGPVHFFALNSCSGEPDGNDAESVQAQWLQQQLATSNQPWKIVYFHHAAYSSGDKHGNNETMQWPFKEWGASAVLGGHDHVYERLLIDGLPYFVNGLGGRSLRTFDNDPEPGSMVRYSADYGAMLITADDTSLRFEFYSVNPADSLVDSFMLQHSAPDVDPLPTAMSYDPTYVNSVTTEVIHIHNRGTTALEIAGVVVEGPDAADFLVLGMDSQRRGRAEQIASSLAVVDPGESHPVSVRFAPRTLGTKHATLRVVSNDPNEGTLDVPMVANVIPQPRPEIHVLPDTLDYGAVQLSLSDTRDVWVSNTGGASLEIDAITMDGADAAEFTLVTGGGAHQLAPGDSVQVVVRCEPVTLGTKQAQMRITSNDPDENTLVVPVWAECIPPAPTIAVPPGVVAFDSIMATTTTYATVRVHNAGLADLEIIGASFEGLDAFEFDVTSFSPVDVAPGDSTALGVSWTPATQGTKSAALRLVSNDPYDNPYDVPVAAFALPPPTPDVLAAVSAVDFGSIDLASAVTDSVVLYNVGTGDLQITDAIVLGPDASHFSVVEVSTWTFAPGDNTTITLEFAPTSAGVRHATLRLTSNDPDESPLDIALSGTASSLPMPDIAVVDALDFGGLVLGAATAMQRVDITNEGSADLTLTGLLLVGADADAFVISQEAASMLLSPGDSTQVEITFSPTAIRPHDAALRILSNDPDENPTHVILTGAGVDPSATQSQVLLQESVTGASSASSSVQTDGNVTAVDGHLYLVAIASKPYRAVTAVDGLDLTWTALVEQCSGREQTGVSLWMARGAPVPGVVHATFDGSTDNAVSIVSRYSGAAVATPIGIVVSANTNGMMGECSGGSDSNSFSLALETSVPEAVVFGAVAARNRDVEPGSDYALLAEEHSGSGGRTASVVTMGRLVTSPGPLTFDGALGGGVDWAAAACEVRSETQRPEISVTPLFYDFGDRDLGSTVSTSFVIANEGNGDLELAAISILGADNAAFSISSGGDPGTLAPGASRTLNVTYAPQSAGAASAALRVVSNDEDEVTIDIPLSGSGLAPMVELVPEWLDFGSLPVGSDLTLGVTLYNVGEANIDVLSSVLLGAHAADFALQSAAAPFTLAPGDSVELDVAFTPLEPGARNATLRLSTSNPAQPSLDVALSGVGASLPEPDIAIAPTAHDFGELALPETALLSVRLWNVGTAPLDVAIPSVTGADSLDFVVTGGPWTLAAGDSADVEVTFAPTAPGPKSAFLRFGSDDPDEPETSVTLAGSAVQTLEPEIVVVPVAHDFGPVQTGASITLHVRIHNPGEATLEVGQTVSIGPDSLDFAVTQGGAPFSVAVGDSAEVGVTFTPSSDGPKSATLRLSSNDADASRVDVVLTGSGFTPAPVHVVFDESMSGTASSATSVETDATLAAVDGGLYLVAVASKSYRPVTGVTGMGLTWTLVQAQCGAREQTGVEVWIGNGTPSPGIVTATFEQQVDRAVLVVSRYSGVDPANAFGSILSANTQGENGVCSGGEDDASFDLEMQTTSADAWVYVAVAMRNRSLTPGDGYVLRDEARHGSTGTTASVAILDQEFAVPGAVGVDGTFDGDVDWAVVSIEIKPAPATAKQADVIVPRIAGLALRNGVGGIDPWIELASPRPDHSNVRIYDVRGRLVDTVWKGAVPAGSTRIAWNGIDRFGRLLPAGIYLVRAEIGPNVLTGKLIILR